jgi:hypothetical protein
LFLDTSPDAIRCTRLPCCIGANVALLGTTNHGAELGKNGLQAFPLPHAVSFCCRGVSPSHHHFSATPPFLLTIVPLFLELATAPHSRSSLLPRPHSPVAHASNFAAAPFAAPSSDFFVVRWSSLHRETSCHHRGT